MRSVWQETALPEFPQLKGDMNTDVLIIGGGLAGVLTAYFLQQNGVKYALVEKDRICSGNTGRTTAKITYQHGLIYHKILKSRGKNVAQKYLDANRQALDRFAKMCSGIDCGFEVKDNYVYSTTDRKKLEDEVKALASLGCRAELCDTVPLPVNTVGAVKVPNQAQFDPVKFVAAISKGLNIFEHTHVHQMVGNTAITDFGRISAKKVVSATHFPFINKHGSYFIKLYQHRSYVIALENTPDVGGMYVDESGSGLSFRNYGSLLLLGGGGSRTGRKNGNWQLLRNFAAKHYPNAQERFFWAAQDCMSLDGVPYIGRYSANTPDFYVETGFNKWGMTGSMVSAMVISDLILTGKSDFSDVFDPSRSILKPQLFINGTEAVVNWLTPSHKVCPHLGCALKWNRAEHSWDCPCHGSRFTKEGRLLDNPANENMRHK